jgi:hypothetical protein
MGFRNPITTAVDPTARSAAAAAQTAANNAQASANSASTAASTAQSTANGKNTIFTQSTTPTANAVNDLWVDTGNGRRLSAWNGSAWAVQQFGNLAISPGTLVASDVLASGTITAAQIAAGTITATQIASGTITAGLIAAGTITATQIASGTITAGLIAAGAVAAGKIAAGAIDGMTITGATLRTAASGARVVVDSVNVDRVKLYTGQEQTDLPGQIQVGYTAGTLSSGDQPYLLLQPPLLGLGASRNSNPTLTLKGPTRDNTTPGGWTVKGATEFTDQATFDVAVSGQAAAGLIGYGIATVNTTGIAATAVRLVSGMPFTTLWALQPGRAYEYIGGLRGLSTVAGDVISAAARLTRGQVATPAATDPVIAAVQVPLGIASTNYPVQPGDLFQVANADTYQVNLWVNRSTGTGSLTAGILSGGHMFHRILDVGPASAGAIPMFTL